MYVCGGTFKLVVCRQSHAMFRASGSGNRWRCGGLGNRGSACRRLKNDSYERKSPIHFAELCWLSGSSVRKIVALMKIDYVSAFFIFILRFSSLHSYDTRVKSNETPSHWRDGTILENRANFKPQRDKSRAELVISPVLVSFQRRCVISWTLGDIPNVLE